MGKSSGAGQNGPSINPPVAREPSCVHSQGKQPASACLTCKDGPELARWKEGWTAWFAAHPDDPRNPNKAGGGVESRGGSPDPAATPTAEPKTALVIVATHNDGEPMVVAGIMGGDIASAIIPWQHAPWSDAHYALETVTYQRLTLMQALERQP